MSVYANVTMVTALTAGMLLSSPVETKAASIACGQGYTVVGGDTLSKISQAAYGSPLYQPIYNANVDVIGTNPDRIFIGQVFNIPCLSANGQAVLVENDNQLVFTFSRPSAPPFVLNEKIIDRYLAEITEVTEGRVSFVDPATVVRDHSQQFEMVTTGQVDGAYVLNSTLSDSHGLLQLTSLPMFGGAAEQTAVAFWRLHEQYLAAADYFPEAELLGFVASPAAHIWRRGDTPVVPTEGISGKNKYHAPYFLGLDTRGPAAMRAELEVLEAELSSESESPAFFMAHGAALAIGLWTAGSNVAVTEVDNGLYTPVFSVILSNEAWTQISEEDRQAIRDVSGEALARRSAEWDAFDNGFRAKMLREGLKFTKADRALLEDLWLSSLGELNEWLIEADEHGIEANNAINFYLTNLRELEDTLIYRADETFVDQHPFVTGGN